MRLCGVMAGTLLAMAATHAGFTFAADATTGVGNPARAEFHYRMHCQGCHGPEGTGTPDGAVPTMNGFVGNFLRVDRGREFLVRVPGSANADMSDAALAEVLNWLLPRISAEQLPDDFRPYNRDEVADWRADPLQDVVGMRNQLIDLLADLNVYEKATTARKAPQE